MLKPQSAENEYPEEPFDKYLSKQIQSWIEQRYYAKIDAHARLEQLLYDPTFIAKPREHASLFSDHGSIHARDVVRNILLVLDSANGILFPARETAELEFMKDYGVKVAYIHDIALFDLSDFGRKMHPYAVAQIVLSPEFDDLFQAMWAENAGNFHNRLSDLSVLKADPAVIFREMLALAVCHSKSAFPLQIFTNPLELREAMLRCATIDLQDMYDHMVQRSVINQSTAEIGPGWISAKVSPERMEILSRYYKKFMEEGFCWLVSEHPLVRQMVEDVIDTLRSLRCADALRQRGTTLKTSGNYEIFVDRKTGNAIIALRNRDRNLILVEIDNPISAGEANLASCELTRDGDLRTSFHRGSFPDQETIKKAVSNAVLVLTDIYKDIIESFQRFSSAGYQKDAGEMQILIENVNDNPEFASLVRNHFQKCNPAIKNPVRVVPSLKDVSERERRFYMEAKDLEWDDQARREALNRIAKSGHKTDSIDLQLAFQDVKKIMIQAGTTLIEAGAQPGFVYIPISGSLRVIPLGGYPPILNQPWTPVGITAVIRGSVRNATVVAEEEVSLLMIPQEIYLSHWHKTYGLNEFVQWMETEKAKQAGESPDDKLRLSK